MGIFNKKPEVSTPNQTNTAPTAGSGGLWSRWSQKMSAATQSFSRNVEDLFLGKRALDASLMEELETLLLQADVGVSATQQILERLTQGIERKELANALAVYQALRSILISMLAPLAQPLRFDHKPLVVMVVGVNGAGKTTSIGKLSHVWQREGKKVLLAAGDTFRAAAGEQLQEWARRSGVTLIQQQTGADAAAVAHDALQAAVARNIDVALIDTAGRLHTQSGLMDELGKIKRVLAKVIPSAPHEVLLVLDGGNGQNALVQLERFHAAVGITGLCITKLDGTAKGGVLVAIAAKTQIPIRYIGLGEQIEDLKPFDAAMFVDALLPPRG